MVIITEDVRGEDGSLFLVGLNLRGTLWRFAMQAWDTANFLPPLASHPLRTSASFKAGRKWGEHINTCKSFGCPDQARLVMSTEAQNVLTNTG